MSRLHVIFILTYLSTSSCSQNRTYLNDEEKTWNPYKDGQVLVFRSADDKYDTLKIIHGKESGFPEGIGAPQHEFLRAVSIQEMPGSLKSIELDFLTVYAKYYNFPSGVDFEFFLGGDTFWGRGYSIDDLKKIKEFKLQTKYGSFNDVIKIGDNKNRTSNNTDILFIYWSKSIGYVKYERVDGKTGELVNIINP